MAASSPFFDWFGRFIDDGLLRELPRSELVVLLVLARHAGRDLKAWPAVARIAEMSGLSGASVYRALDDLYGRGLIDWHEDSKQGGRGRTYRLRVYRLRLPEAQPTPSHPQEHAHPP